ncbi:muramidase family protein [Paenibacillus albus]|uniref:LysM peptidoglycan-binding domain-containing protein n=1 Tax=Paenibacillus albus TaxID=2495582 RepID=A0A3S9A6E1_9BACL|nr:LysM peptidoglycan-binding domain-containing protein [Paenibacillus albus]AZN41256.1 LysM peptidoglycan-binding domain-containing protein [Paenibacillus albus]
MKPNSTNPKYGPRAMRAKKRRTASILQVSTGLLLMSVVLYSIYATQSHFGQKHPLASSPNGQPVAEAVTGSSTKDAKPASGHGDATSSTTKPEKTAQVKDGQSGSISTSKPSTTHTSSPSGASTASTAVSKPTTAVKDVRPVSTASASVPASGSSSAYPKKYVIQKGDTLSKIAMKFYHSKQQVNLIAEANDILFINDMVEGETITIPSPTGAAGASSGKQRDLDYSKVTLPATYLVQSGDTLYHIAKQFYRSEDYVEMIASHNNLDANAGLKAGTSLLIPALPKHKVKAGDTLSSIARLYYGDTKYANELASYNELDNHDVVRVGDELSLPQLDTKQ